MKLNVAILAILMFASCVDSKEKPSNPHNQNEEEVITTLKFQLTDTNGVQTTFVYSDPDGDGGNNPVQHDTIYLSTMKYEFMRQLDNEQHRKKTKTD